MKRTAVINIVGLTETLLGQATPRLEQFRQKASTIRIVPAFPAVTCTAQSNYLTGKTPTEHGIVGNGWYNRDLAEVQFWKQSNRLVQSRKLWEDLRAHHPGFTCAKLFWWYNMYSSADWSITPRPMYPADGRKVFDVYTRPASLRSEIKKDLGEFPFATFWGPAAGIHSPQGKPEAASRWIAEAAKWIERRHHPDLNLVYLPHLDYNLQRLGPNHPNLKDDVRRIDEIAGDLADFFQRQSVQAILLSEYGIESVNNPVHPNRILRQQGWLTIKEELGLELLDAGASRVFAVADHQVAHIYLNDRSLESQARAALEATPGVARVLGPAEKAAEGIDHPRAGDLVAVAAQNAWFTYYYWHDDAVAPDFARTVDIHRKPGYDPVELFLDPVIALPRLKLAWRLLQKKLGFRMLMDVIPLNATLVKGSHGAVPGNPGAYPVLIGPRPPLTNADCVPSTEVYNLLKKTIIGV